jgi:hypothetical protein
MTADNLQTNGAKKLLRKKRNESWAIPAMAGQQVRLSRVGGNLLCEIAQYVLLYSV